MSGQDNGRAAERVGMRVQQRPPGTEARAGKFPGPSLIPVLTAIQREHGWLPREELVKLSQEARRPLYEIEGLISFYPHFRTAPPAKVQLAVCHDLSCWLHGADERIAELKARYGDDVDVELVRGLLPRALRRRARGRRRRAARVAGGGRRAGRRGARRRARGRRGQGARTGPGPTTRTSRAASATGRSAACSPASSTPTRSPPR